MSDVENYVIDPQVEILVWDLDGTILNSFDYGFDLWQAVMIHHGFDPPTRDQYARNYHGTVIETARGLMPTATDTKLEEVLVDFFKLDDNHIDDVDSFLFSDAVGLVKRAADAGLRQIIVTNRGHGTERGNASPRTMVQNSSLRGSISEIICGDEVIERKPSIHVLDGYNIVPEKTLVIGDQSVDSQFAANLGCRAIIVCRTDDHAVLHAAELAKDHCRAVSTLDLVIVDGQAL